MKITIFLGKVSYALSANLLSLAISLLTTLIVPKVIGVEEFGYFQLFIFYTSYVGLSHFGWNDGLFLRLGGKKYEDLEKGPIFSQFIVLILQQFSVTLIIGLIGYFFVDDFNIRFIILMTALCVVIAGPTYMLLFLLQATSRIKEYARVVVLQRMLFGIFVVLIAVTPYISFEYLVWGDLSSRMIALIGSIYYCRDIVFLNISKFKFPKYEISANIRAGFPLMLSAMAGSLMIGVVRFGIAENWPISVFGKVALALSLSTMVLTAVVTVGQVLFPLLRRAQSSQLPKIYSAGRLILSLLTLSALGLYFIITPLISFWLPSYQDTIVYLGILFPLFIYQIKTIILVEPYLKTMRREKLLLWVNVSVLALSILLTWISTYILNVLVLALVAIVFLVALRAYVLEIHVARAMNVSFWISACLETGVVIAFLLSIIFLNGVWTLLVFITALTTWITLNWHSLVTSIHFIKS